jgi:hypothetical protein
MPDVPLPKEFWPNNLDELGPAYKAGFWARCMVCDDGYVDNPYEPDTDQELQWVEGFYEADRRLGVVASPHNHI